MWASIANNTPSQYTSAILPPQRSSASASTPSDTLAAVFRQVTYVQRELQSLLDAQSTGLLSGLGHDPHLQSPTQSSQQSRKPSIRTPSRSLPGPIHLPLSPTRYETNTLEPRKEAPVVSLNTARSSIHKALLRLSELKGSESAALTAQQDGIAEFLSSLEALAAKKNGIEDAIREIEAGELAGSTLSGGRGGGNGERRIGRNLSPSSLKDEEASLTSEIHSTETRLYELKARLAHIRRLRQERGNKLAARLSSWKGALADVDKSIQQEVLEGRGLEDLYAALRSAGRKKKEGQGVWTLPKERRTVQLVKEEVNGKAEELAGRKEEVDKEEKACVDGANIWSIVVDKVQAVERRMKVEMRKLGDTQDFEMPEGAHNGMLGVLELMDVTIGELKEEVTAAGGKGWNLLLCAMGAELEAMRQGREMLQLALSGSNSHADSHVLEELESSMMTARSRFSDQRRQTAGSERRDNGDSAADGASNPLVDFDSDRRHNVADSVSAVEMQSFNQPAEGYRDDPEDDDEPGPDLLVEHISE